MNWEWLLPARNGTAGHMCAISDPAISGPSDEAPDCLHSARRRRVLEILQGPADPITLEALADELASHADVVDGDPAARRRQAELLLHHVDLPKLVEAGVVEWERTANTVRGDAERIRDALERYSARGSTEELAKKHVICLAHPYRRVVLECLIPTSTAASVHDLVTSIASRVTDETDPATIAIALRHHHLPRLAEANLVTYDSDRGQVEPTPTLRGLAIP